MFGKNEVIKGLIFIAIGGCAAKAIQMTKTYKQRKDADAQILELDYEDEQ